MLLTKCGEGNRGVQKMLFTKCGEGNREVKKCLQNVVREIEESKNDVYKLW